MSSGWGAHNFTALSALAIKVSTDYKDVLDGYGYISEEVLSLQALIDKVAYHFKTTPLSSNYRGDSQKILESCQSVLEDLNSLIEKYKRLASTTKGPVFMSVKLGKEDLVTLQERLMLNVVVLRSLVRTYEYIETRVQLTVILGLHHTTERISLTSIASFAMNPNTPAAYKRFCEDLYQIGVTEEMILLKEKEILALLKSQGMVAGDQFGGKNIQDQTRLLGADSGSTGNSGPTIFKPSFRLTSGLIWSQSRFRMGQSSMDSPPIGFKAQDTFLMPEANTSSRLLLGSDKTHFDIVELLLRTGTSVDITDQDKNTLLHCAARDGYTNTAKLLLNRGAPIEAVNKENNTPLHVAAQNGHAGVVGLLLRNGAKIEAFGQHDNTSLHLAASRGHIGVVEVLLKKGASIEAIGEYGNTPLNSAAMEGHTGVVEVLLEKGALIEARNQYNNDSLALASSRGRTGVVEVLLNKGASIDAAGQHANTALISAAAGGHAGPVEVLLDNDASIEAENTSGNTPLSVAAWEGHTGVVEVLLKRGALIQTINANGNTPLHCAAIQGHTEIVEVLLRHGASTETRNKNNKTPLRLATQKGHTDIVKLLNNKPTEVVGKAHGAHSRHQSFIRRLWGDNEE